MFFCEGPELPDLREVCWSENKSRVGKEDFTPSRSQNRT